MRKKIILSLFCGGEFSSLDIEVVGSTMDSYGAPRRMTIDQYIRDIIQNAAFGLL